MNVILAASSKKTDSLRFLFKIVWSMPDILITKTAVKTVFRLAVSGS